CEAAPRRQLTMKARLLICGVVAAALTTGTATAQPRMPHTGAAAIGGEVGVFLPAANGMKGGPDVQGFYEHYMTARDSVRLAVEWANPKVEVDTSSSVRQVRIGGDFIH